MGGLHIEDRAICDGVDERIEELNHKISKLKIWMRDWRLLIV